MAIIDIEIPNWRPALLNQYIGKHWSVGAKLKKRDKAMVLAFACNKPKATGKRRVDLFITLGTRQRQSDYDAPWKSLLDALVNCKMLIDDNAAGVQLGDIIYDRGKAKTIIRLTDLY